MKIDKSCGKLINNNISLAEGIKQGIKRQAGSTVSHAGREIMRNAEHSATDRDTQKVITKTTKATAPVVTIVSAINDIHTVATTQKIATWAAKKAGFEGTGFVEAVANKGMAPKTMGDVTKGKFSEVNASMDQVISIDATDKRFSSFKNGDRIVSTKGETATFRINHETGEASIYVKHKHGAAENKSVFREYSRTIKKNMNQAFKAKDFKEAGRLYKENFFAKAAAKAGEKQAKALKNLSLMGRPKQLVSQFLRLGTSSLEGSEASQGMNLAMSAKTPCIALTKIAIKTQIAIGYNIHVTTIRAIQMGKQLHSGDSFLKAMKNTNKMMKMRKIKYGGSKTAMKMIRNKIASGFRSLKLNMAQRMFGKNHMFVSYIKERNALKMKLSEAGTKGKAALKIQRKIFIKDVSKIVGDKIKAKIAEKAAKNKALEKAVNAANKVQTGAKNIAEKIIKSRMIRFFAALKTKFLDSKFAKGAGKIVSTIFKAIGAVFNGIKAAIQAILAVIKGVLLALCGFILVGLLIIHIGLLFDSKKAYERENAAFDISMEDGTAIMDTLRAEHNAYVAEIEKLASKYDATDIQYPSGSKENYKELFCAMVVEMDYDLTKVKDKSLKEMAKNLYEQTHIITTEEYTFLYDDGTEGKACHIYVDIQRNETLAYSIFEGVVPDQVYSDGGIAPIGEANIENWMDCVQTVKTLIAQTQVSYNQKLYLSIEVNGERYRPRADCSGYVSACLWVYGSLSKSICPSTEYLQGLGEYGLPGFTKIPWPGWDNLQQGDIIVRRYPVRTNSGTDWVGHTEIFYANNGDQHLVYSNGCTNDLRSSYPTSDSTKAYDWVFRPNNAGELTEEDQSAVDVIFGEREYLFRSWNRSFGENAFILASNQSDIVYEKETGNEAGYDSAILATVEAAKNGSFCPTQSWGGLSKTNYVAKENTYYRPSSLDYIRYICAQHGVCADYSPYMMLNNCYTTSGDLIGTVESEEDSEEDDPIIGIPYCLTTGNDDVGNLRVGDIMYYVAEDALYDQKWDDIDYNEWPKDTNRYNDMLDHIYPMMYIGDGNFTYYYNGSIYTKHITKLQMNRCLNKEIIRYIGFTVNPVYGSTPSFCGWTDYKIGELIIMINSTHWTDESKTKRLTSYGFTEEEQEEIRNNTDEEDLEMWENPDKEDLNLSPLEYKDVDYSFYSEDYFDADVYKHSEKHENMLMYEITLEAIKYYDTLGMLPSTVFSHMAAVSNFRSTEESLKYFNIFEVYDTDGPNVEKFSYDGDGNASSVLKGFKTYSSYYEAFVDWENYLVGNGYDPNILAESETECFQTQKDNYVWYGAISGSLGSKMSDVYSKYKDELDAYDAMAIERKKAIELVVQYTDSLNNTNLPAVKPSKSEFYTLCARMDLLKSASEKLNDLLIEQNSATDRTTVILMAAKDAWQNAEPKRQAAYQYYQSHLEEDYVESWYCAGWLVYDEPESEKNKDEKEEEKKDDPDKKKTFHIEYCCNSSEYGYMTTAQIRERCPHAVITYENWEEHGDKCGSFHAWSWYE